jgi:hypothetical protein
MYEMGFYISEDGILHSHCREALKFYTNVWGRTAKGNVWNYWRTVPEGSITFHIAVYIF